jgi:1-acyl-sn-glycerol-3-phosphate acyltransferase
VVPVTINNSWKLFKHGNFPIDLGVNVTLKTHKPIPVSSVDPESLAAQVERIITADIR